MQFDKDLIEQIKAANPIEDVVQHWMDEHGMPMRRSGADIFAHHHVWRPVANPGTALWVTPSNQGWSCFSCKQGGDVIHLVQSFMYGDDYEQRNISQLTEALRWLAERAGITYDPTSECDPEFLELRIIYSIYGDFINYCIKNCNTDKYSDETAKLIKDRYPLDDETIEKFKITIFRRNWTGPFYNKMLEKYTHSELVGSGLWQEFKDEVSCTFQGRMIIPYIQNGDVVYMIGRETPLSGFEDEEGNWKNYDRGAKFKKISKYVEDRPFTHGISSLVRNDYVFGTDSIKNSQDIIITEGIGDCLVLLQAGFRSISPVTTSFKNEMLEPVAKTLMKVRQIYIANDNEESKGGEHGAERMHKFFLAKGLDAKIVTLPRPEGVNKMDVAEFFRDHTVDDFKDLLGKASSILDLEILKLAPGSHRLDVEKIWEKILNMPNFERIVYEDKLAKQLKFKSASKLRETFGAKRKGAITKKLVFEAPARLVPGLDFLKDDEGTRTVHLTQFMPVQEDKEDGRSEIVVMPFLLSNEINLDGREKLEVRDLLAEPLSEVEMDRLPDESITFNRWRLDAKYPFSISNFINAEVRKKPTVDSVFHEIHALYDDYFWYPHDYEKTMQTLYIILTYFYQMFNAVPGLHLTGQMNSGKSNSMKLMTEMSFNAIYAIEARAPFIFRGSHNNRSLLILDEGEQYTGDSLDAEKDAILSILRGRYKKGTNVPRTEKNSAGKMVQNMYDAFGPLVIGSIAHLEGTFSSRMIIVECLTKSNTDGAKLMKFDEERIIPRCHDIRDKLYTLMMSEFTTVWKCMEHMKNDPRIKHIENREWEKWLPIFAIAHWIDTASKHTQKNLVDALIPVQKHKEQVRHDMETSLNRELVVLVGARTILTQKHDHNFKVLDIGDKNLAFPADKFYLKMNDRLRELQLQRTFDMQYRGYFENILRKTQVWRAGEGLQDDKGLIIINMERLDIAIQRITQ